jgi:hypothetical protein
MSDITFATSGNWALATDGNQWILQKNGGTDKRSGKPVWTNVSFVHSTKDILARCMKEKGTPPEDAEKLLAGLGRRFSVPQVPHPSPSTKNARQELTV